MVLLLLLLACQPEEDAGKLGIRIEKIGDTLHVAISPSTLTATLHQRLKLNPGQVRIINRIVLETTAEAEDASCGSHAHHHPEKEFRTLLRRMDRCIEKQLSPHQRTRYQKLKKERGKATVRQAKVE